MLYGSLNNWKCASTYFSLHRSHSFSYIFLFPTTAVAFYSWCWCCCFCCLVLVYFRTPFYMRKYVLYIGKELEMARGRTKKKVDDVWLQIQWFQIQFCKELVMVHDDVHTPISKCIHTHIQRMREISFGSLICASSV